LCVNQHSWHPTSKDLGTAKTLNNLHYIAFTNEQDETYPLVVTYIQLSTHSYIHTNYTFKCVRAHTHTHTCARVHIHILIYNTYMHSIDPLFHHMAFGYEKVTIL